MVKITRYMKISSGNECQFKFHNKVLVVKRCRKIGTKKTIPIKEILNELGIKSL